MCLQGGRREGPPAVCSSLGVHDSLHPRPGPLLLAADLLHDTLPLPHGLVARWDRWLSEQKEWNRFKTWDGSWGTPSHNVCCYLKSNFFKARERLKYWNHNIPWNLFKVVLMSLCFLSWSVLSLSVSVTLFYCVIYEMIPNFENILGAKYEFWMHLQGIF